MSVKLDIPFNIELLILDEKSRAMMRPVTSLAVFDGATKNFNPDGLYSNEIFGGVGTAARSTRHSYIDLRVTIMHPVIYKALVSLRGFYQDIMASKEFAKFDDDKGDFVPANMLEGQTGYQFFMENFHKLRIKDNASVKRQLAMELFEKYKGRFMIRYPAVIPAGLRDMEVDDNGRETSDKVNELYWKLISLSNTIDRAGALAAVASYNAQRVAMQNTMMEIYTYFSTAVEGKHGLFMGKWTARNIYNGTRNVITSADTTSKEFGHPRNMGFNDTLVGLYQTSKAMLPITLARLRQGFLERCFSGMGAPAILTDPKTLQSVTVQLSPIVYSEWLSNEGLEKRLTYFEEDTIRHDPIMVEDYYLGLCYRGPDGTFAFISGIEQLPEDRLAEHCTPITMAELLYVSLYEVTSKYPCLITRYPITGPGSVYASWIQLRTTVNAQERRPLNPDTWEVDENQPVAYQFPMLGSSFYNSLSPHPKNLARLGADFDGDTVSFNVLYSDEAIAEVRGYLNSKKAYVGTDGRLLYDTSVDTIQHVLRNMTGARRYVPPQLPQARMLAMAG